MENADLLGSASASAASAAAPVLLPERWAVRIGADEVALTPTQFRLLQVMAAEPGRPFSRQDLIDQVIGRRVTERTIDVHIKELRRKLGQHSHWLHTVRGVGYTVGNSRSGSAT
ncbi:MAG TPA: winged helix-turn-helix domain-containing protein [Gemmataceae bacterium]|nr:winged helix-turn-helix domain-containing protein [Gemmataceae bacterium]